MEALHEEEQLRFCPWTHNNRKEAKFEVRESNEKTIQSVGRRATTGGREIALCGVQQLVEPRKMSA